MNTLTELPSAFSRQYIKGMFPVVNKWTSALILLCAIIVFLICTQTPIFDDDTSFIMVLRDNNGNILPLRELIKTFTNLFNHHYQSANGRLLDKLIPLVMQTPRWIPAILTSIAYTVLTYLLISLSAAPGKPTIAVTIVFVYNICFPWLNDMFTTACSGNYIWSAALALTTMYLFLHPFRIGKDKIPLSAFIFVFCAFSGAAHEAYSLPVMAGFAVYAIIKRAQLLPSQILIIAAWLTGTLFIFLAPGIYARLEIYPNLHNQVTNPASFRTLLKLAIFGIPVGLYIAGILFSLFHKNLRKRLHDDIHIILITATTVSLALDAYLLFQLRPIWMTDTFALTGFAALLCQMKIRAPKILKTASISAMVAILLANMLTTLYWQHFVYTKYNQIMRMHRESPGEVIEMDIPTRLPLICLLKPNLKLLHKQCYFYFDNETSREVNIKDISIVPHDVKEYEEELSVSTPLGGEYYCALYNGHIISQSEYLATKHTKKLITELKNGKRENITYSINRFTGKDGHTYVFMNPMLPYNCEIEDIAAIY